MSVESRQPPPPRQWLRFPSISRPAVPPIPAAALPPLVAAPPPPATPLLRPSLPFTTLVRQVAPESPPRPTLLARAASTDLRAKLPPQPQERTPPPTATAPPPSPITEIHIPPTSSRLTPAAATTGPPVPSLAIQKPVTPSAALPADVKTLNKMSPHSPHHKPAPPPQLSPLKLPSLQIKSSDENVLPQKPLEAERKDLLFQKITTVPERKLGGRDVIYLAGAQKPDTAAAVGKGTIDGTAGIVKKKPEYWHKGIDLISIAGENRGATMELTLAATHRPPKKGNPSSSSDEGKHRAEDRGRKGNAAVMTFPPTVLYVNSNIQGVHNSILYNSSYSHCDPSVHMTLTRKPADGGFPRIKDRKA